MVSNLSNKKCSGIQVTLPKNFKYSGPEISVDYTPNEKEFGSDEVDYIATEGLLKATFQSTFSENENPLIERINRITNRNGNKVKAIVQVLLPLLYYKESDKARALPNLLIYIYQLQEEFLSHKNSVSLTQGLIYLSGLQEYVGKELKVQITKKNSIFKKDQLNIEKELIKNLESIISYLQILHEIRDKKLQAEVQSSQKENQNLKKSNLGHYLLGTIVEAGTFIKDGYLIRKYPLAPLKHLLGRTMYNALDDATQLYSSDFTPSQYPLETAGIAALAGLVAGVCWSGTKYYGIGSYSEDYIGKSLHCNLILILYHEYKLVTNKSINDNLYKHLYKFLNKQGQLIFQSEKAKKFKEIHKKDYPKIEKQTEEKIEKPVEEKVEKQIEEPLEQRIGKSLEEQTMRKEQILGEPLLKPHKNVLNNKNESENGRAYGSYYNFFKYTHNEKKINTYLQQATYEEQAIKVLNSYLESPANSNYKPISQLKDDIQKAIDNSKVELLANLISELRNLIQYAFEQLKEPYSISDKKSQELAEAYLYHFLDRHTITTKNYCGNLLFYMLLLSRNNKKNINEVSAPKQKLEEIYSLYLKHNPTIKFLKISNYVQALNLIHERLTHASITQAASLSLLQELLFGIFSCQKTDLNQKISLLKTIEIELERGLKGAFNSAFKANPNFSKFLLSGGVGYFLHSWIVWHGILSLFGLNKVVDYPRKLLYLELGWATYSAGIGMADIPYNSSKLADTLKKCFQLFITEPNLEVTLKKISSSIAQVPSQMLDFEESKIKTPEGQIRQIEFEEKKSYSETSLNISEEIRHPLLKETSYPSAIYSSSRIKEEVAESIREGRVYSISRIENKPLEGRNEESDISPLEQLDKKCSSKISIDNFQQSLLQCIEENRAKITENNIYKLINSEPELGYLAFVTLCKENNCCLLKTFLDRIKGTNLEVEFLLNIWPNLYLRHYAKLPNYQLANMINFELEEFKNFTLSIEGAYTHDIALIKVMEFLALAILDRNPLRGLYKLAYLINSILRDDSTSSFYLNLKNKSPLNCFLCRLGGRVLGAVIFPVTAALVTTSLNPFLIGACTVIGNIFRGTISIAASITLEHGNTKTHTLLSSALEESFNGHKWNELSNEQKKLLNKIKGYLHTKEKRKKILYEGYEVNPLLDNVDLLTQQEVLLVRFKNLPSYYSFPNSSDLNLDKLCSDLEKFYELFNKEATFQSACEMCQAALNLDSISKEEYEKLIKYSPPSTNSQPNDITQDKVDPGIAQANKLNQNLEFINKQFLDKVYLDDPANMREFKKFEHKVRLINSIDSTMEESKVRSIIDEICKLDKSLKREIDEYTQDSFAKKFNEESAQKLKKAILELILNSYIRNIIAGIDKYEISYRTFRFLAFISNCQALSLLDKIVVKIHVFSLLENNYIDNIREDRSLIHIRDLGYTELIFAICASAATIFALPDLRDMPPIGKFLIAGGADTLAASLNPSNNTKRHTRSYQGMCHFIKITSMYDMFKLEGIEKNDNHMLESIIRKSYFTVGENSDEKISHVKNNFCTMLKTHTARWPNVGETTTYKKYSKYQRRI